MNRYIPDNEDKPLVHTLLNDALMNAKYDDEELYFAYVKVLEEYIYTGKIAEFRKQMIQYWKDKEKERESY